MVSVLKEEDEKVLYNLVKEYAKKKPIIEIKDLVNFLNNRLKLNLNFNRNKIELILKRFIKNQIILIGKKLVKEDILKTRIRSKINDLIIDCPGININQIMNELNIGANRALWHLKLLSNFKFIRVIKFESQKNFFKFDSDSKSDVLHIILRNEKVKSILDILRNNNEPSRPTALSELLSIHYNTLKKYLNKLLELNLVKKVNGNKKKRYIFNEDIDQDTLDIIDSA